jgi:hypothetical protein
MMDAPPHAISAEQRLARPPTLTRSYDRVAAVRICDGWRNSLDAISPAILSTRAFRREINFPAAGRSSQGRVASRCRAAPTAN